MLASWIALVLAFTIMIRSIGPEYGLSYASAALSCVGLVLVGANLELRPCRQAGVSLAKGRAHGNASIQTSVSQKCGTFLVAGPIAGIASCQVVLVATYYAFGANAVPNALGMAMAAIVFPAFWGITAYMVCMLNQTKKLALILLSVASFSSVLLYFT